LSDWPIEKTLGDVSIPRTELEIANKQYVDEQITPGPVPPTEASSLWWLTYTRKLGSWSEALIWNLSTFVSEGDERLGSLVNWADVRMTFLQWGYRSYGTTYLDQPMQLLLNREPSAVLIDSVIPANSAAKSEFVNLDMSVNYPNGLWWDVSPPAGGTPPTGAPSDWVLAINMRFEYTPPAAKAAAARAESIDARLRALELGAERLERKVPGRSNALSLLGSRLSRLARVPGSRGQI